MARTKKIEKKSNPENVLFRFDETFDESNPEETNQQIIETIKKWLPSFERAGYTAADVIWAMIHFAATDDQFLASYMGGFLENAGLDDSWLFNPWSGEEIMRPEPSEKAAKGRE